MQDYETNNDYGRVFVVLCSYSEGPNEITSVHLNKHCAVEEIKKDCEETREFLLKLYPEEDIRYFASENEDEFSIWVSNSAEYFDWAIEEHAVRL